MPKSGLHTLCIAVVYKRAPGKVAPAGTVDPTPFLYDSTFYTMGGVLAVAAVANGLIRQVCRRGVAIGRSRECFGCFGALRGESADREIPWSFWR